MNDYIKELEKKLKAHKVEDLETIISDYNDFFISQESEGYSYDDICSKLGNIDELVAEYDTSKLNINEFIELLDLVDNINVKNIKFEIAKSTTGKIEVDTNMTDLNVTNNCLSLVDLKPFRIKPLYFKLKLADVKQFNKLEISSSKVKISDVYANTLMISSSKVDIDNVESDDIIIDSCAITIDTVSTNSIVIKKSNVTFNTLSAIEFNVDSSNVKIKEFNSELIKGELIKSNVKVAKLNCTDIRLLNKHSNFSY